MEQEGMGDIALGNFNSTKIREVYCWCKAWNWTKQRFSWSGLAMRTNKPTKAVEKLNRLFQQVVNSVKKSSH